MLNNGSITTTPLTNVNQILGNDHFVAVGAVIDNTAKNSDGVCLAGTPLTGDLLLRNGGANAFTKASVSGDTKGVWTVQITTAFDNDETIVIGGVTYTKKASESVSDKQFEGASAALQITSLLKMVTLEGFDVAAVTGATDKLGFTQKVADSTGSAPTVTKTGTTGAIGSVTKVTDPVDGTNNANCVLMHDISFDGSSDANATVLIHGVIQKAKCDSSVQTLLDSHAVEALAANGIYVI